MKHKGRACVLFTAFLPSCYAPFEQMMLLECEATESYAGWFISAKLEASSVWDEIWQQVSHVPLLCERYWHTDHRYFLNNRASHFTHVKSSGLSESYLVCGFQSNRLSWVTNQNCPTVI